MARPRIVGPVPSGEKVPTCSSYSTRSLRARPVQSRSLQAKLEPLNRRLTAATEELDRKNRNFAAGQEYARLSIERLRGSVAQLQVLVAALEEIRLALRILRLVRTGR